MEVFLKNKNYCLAILGLILSFYCIAQSPTVRTEYRTDKLCKYIDFHHEPFRFQWLTWDGECKNDYISGTGTLVIKHIRGFLTTIIKTTFQDGLANGSGEEISQSSDGKAVFKGEWVGGLRNGIGKIIYPNGDIYEGNFVNGMLDGRGKEVRTDGKVIEGAYSKNRLTNGKIIFPSGEIQTGEFEGGRLNGKGKLVRKDGTILEGNFIWGFLGNGKIIFSTGVIDEGNFTNLQERPNQLVETVLNGLGTRISIGGDIYKGNWANGVMTGEATIQYKNGNTYTGKVTYPIANGQGKMTYINGITYEGLFKESKRWGVFSVTAKDGKKTIQTYQDDVLVPTVTSISTNSSSSSSNAPANSISSDNSLLDFEDAKKKCASIGFKPATEQFGKCVLKFTK